MILTHFIMFKFMSGAGDSGDIYIAGVGISRIHQGVGLALSPGPRDRY